MFSIFQSLTVIFLASTTVTSVSISLSPNTTIDSGVVIGTTASIPTSPFVVRKFLGIPFAAPPVRFKPPQPPIPWTEAYNASTYRPSCFQQFDYPVENRDKLIKLSNTPGPPAGESEDCLTLNVFEPENGEIGKAVLFWIYGGSFSSGSGSLPMYDGSILAARHDIVVVTSNYRTNIFGFPGSSEIPEQERNLGLLDQRFALDWVQRNIASFNGNPRRVTIFGESAGAGSVDALLTSPPDPIPFQAGILESGQITLGSSGTDSINSWAKLVKATNCPQEGTLDCIRGKPASRLKDIVEQLALPFGPMPDGHTLSKSPRHDRLMSKNDASLIARVPVLFGSNANEASIYVIGQNNTESFLQMALRILYPSGLPEQTEKNMIKKILDAYSLGQAGTLTETDRIDLIVTEVIAQCKIKTVAEESQSVGIPTYRYYFNASFPNSDIFNGSGAYHSSEIPMVFGTYNREAATEFQSEVSNSMQKTWADFAKNPQKGPGWKTLPEIGVFGGGVRAGEAVRGRPAFSLADADLDKRCILWQSLWN